MINNDLIYEIILDNIDLLLSDNITETFNNIKQATSNIVVHYYFVNEINIISESDFIDYFKNAEASTIGRSIQALLVTSDVAAGTIASHGVVSSYLGTLATNIFGTGFYASIATLSAALAPLLLVVIGFVIYKKISKSDALNVFIMIKNLDKLSKYLKFSIDSRLNTEFKNLLQNKCNVIDDKNLRSECAINGYTKFLNEYVLSKLVVEYVKYLKANNEDLSEIHSFNELARFKSQSNRNISNLMNNFYSSYLKFLSNLKINNAIIGDNFRLLNNITKTALIEKVN
jgi:hypothetical protein